MHRDTFARGDTFAQRDTFARRHFNPSLTVRVGLGLGLRLSVRIRVGVDVRFKCLAVQKCPRGKVSYRAKVSLCNFVSHPKTQVKDNPFAKKCIKVGSILKNCADPYIRSTLLKITQFARQ